MTRVAPSWCGPAARQFPLGQTEAPELLSALLGNGGELQPLKELILAKTEGNPFFMEEVVQTLAEEQVLRGEHGQYRLEHTPTVLHIPSTVQAVLAATVAAATQRRRLSISSVSGDRRYRGPRIRKRSDTSPLPWSC